MSIVELLTNYAEFLQENLLVLPGALVGIVAWMISGCLASTIAELRQRNPYVHLVMGLLIPYLYPLVILFVLPVRRGKKDAVADAVAQRGEGAPPPSQKLPSGNQESEDEVDLLEENGDVPSWDRLRFKGMATDIEGNSRGPFLILMKDGHEQRAERILDALDATVVIEIIDHKDEQQRLRLPYDQIEDCTEL